MTETHRRPGRSTTHRPGFVYLHTVRRVDSAGMLAAGVEHGYVGQSRNVARRTLQHAGVLPQRTGEKVQQAWWDLRVGEVRILEQGSWTDVELDIRERYWIAALQPRYNDRDNPRQDRIRKIEARRHREVRDAARGFQLQHLAALWRRWMWWPVAWVALTCVAGGVAVDVSGHDLTPGGVLGVGVVVAVVLAQVRRWWRTSACKRWNKWKRRFP